MILAVAAHRSRLKALTLGNSVENEDVKLKLLSICRRNRGTLLKLVLEAEIDKRLIEKIVDIRPSVAFYAPVKQRNNRYADHMVALGSTVRHLWTRSEKEFEENFTVKEVEETMNSFDCAVMHLQKNFAKCTLRFISL